VVGDGAKAVNEKSLTVFFAYFVCIIVRTLQQHHDFMISRIHEPAQEHDRHHKTSIGRHLLFPSINLHLHSRSAFAYLLPSSPCTILGSFQMKRTLTSASPEPSFTQKKSKMEGERELRIAFEGCVSLSSICCEKKTS
jgi:hypothetical protein